MSVLHDRKKLDEGFEKKLRDNFVNAEGRLIDGGKLEYISVVSEYKKLGYDLNLLSFELDIPEQEIQNCKEQLELRIFAKESIQSGEIQIAIEKLNDFVKNNPNSIVEKMMLLKLEAYVNKTKVNNEDLKQIENVRFVWITDGKGWNPSRKNLEDAYDVIEHLYIIKDLEDGILERI